MVKKKLLIFGISQMGEVANYYFSKHSDYDVCGFIADKEFKNLDTFQNKPVYSTENIVINELQNDFDIFIAIGFSELNKIREDKYKYFKNKGFNFASYISENANVLTDKIGENCFILEDNTIQPFSEIGNNCIVWSGNHIGHHSKIQNNCFISSHVVISGNCHIGDKSFIGVNSSIADGVSIGKSCFIGLGVSVTKNLEDFSKVTVKNNHEFL